MRKGKNLVSGILVTPLNTLLKRSVAAVLVGFLFLVYVSRDSALAASGGRMGGRSFSLGTPSSSSKGFRSSSSSSRSSRTPNYISSSSSRIYTSSPSRSHSSSSTYKCRSSSSVTNNKPSNPTPWKENEPSHCVSGVSPSTVTLKSKLSEPNAPKKNETHNAIVFFVGFCCGIPVLWAVFQCLYEGSKSRVPMDVHIGTNSVLRLQVGLMGSGRSLQKELNEIAETADTSTSEGISHILTETIVALLRHPDYIISSYSSVDVKKSTDQCEEKFNQLSVEERAKLDEETFINVDNMKKKSSKTFKSNGSSNNYLVVTILVAAQCGIELPSLNTSNDLKKALEKVASIPSRKILAVEVLWTPQNEADTLPEQELLKRYPLLQPLLSES